MVARIKSSFNEQLSRLVEQYQKEVGKEVIDLDSVYDWARDRGFYIPRRRSERTEFKRLVGRALREQHVTDPQGRRVRKHHAAKVEIKGESKYLWSNIYEAPPQHMQLSLMQRRNHIVALAVQHDTDTESYNENNRHGAQLQFNYDLEPDIAERKLPTEYPDEAPSED